MADFRRWILAFAAVTLLLGLVPTANAQGNTGSFQCVANAAVPPNVRNEGLTEIVGDIVLNCTGGTPTPLGQVIPQANITVFFNAQVTSRLLSSSGASEAILMIDDPAPGTAVPCLTSPTCNILGVGATDATSARNEFKLGNPNAFQGVVSGNSVSWTGIPVEPPGSQFTRVYRMTNVRLNATNAGLGPGGTPGQLIAFISATPATSPSTGFTSSFPINNPQQIVAFALPSLTTSLRNVSGSAALDTGGVLVQQCISVPAGTAIARLRYTELFQTAFKPQYALPTVTGGSVVFSQNTPGNIWNSESGFFYSGNSTFLGAGQASFGTRLKAVFNNIPNGVSIWVTTINVNHDIVATVDQHDQDAVLTATASGVYSPVVGSVPTGFSNTVAQLTPVSGSATAVWEVTFANPLVAQSYDFGVFIQTTANPGANSPALGIGTVNMSYAPVPADLGVSTATAGTASTSLPVPRFIDTSTANNLLKVVVCRTNLLYPFVTNQAGFDTGLAISNTSTDPFGTATQQGNCTLNFYGANAPAAVTTPVVNTGTSYTTLASTQAANFQGYVIAVCNFQYAHGFAFVSDVGARNLAMGYLALIIPDVPRAAVPFPCYTLSGCPTTGEQLGY